MDMLLPTLYAKVGALLAVSMIISSLGVYVGRGIRSGGAMIGLGIAFIVGVIFVFIASGGNPIVGVSVLFAWVLISGLFIGPVIQAYSEQLGWQTVFLAFLGTAGAMIVFGGIGIFSGVDFSGMGMYLGAALLGLILFGIVGIFVKMSRQVNIVYALLGLVIFSGYFIFDFFRLSKSENTWQAAIMLTTQIYLDFLNFMLKLLELLAALSDKHH